MTIRSINTSGLPQGVLDTVNQLLFDASQVGGNLPFTDFSKIWQDSAGTTPYTAVEQYVGKIVDKSPNALAFTQATSAARPVVSARVNLVGAKTEGITTGGNNLDFVAGIVVDRYGVGVRKATPNASNSGHYYSISPASYKKAGKYRIRFEAKAGEYGFVVAQSRSNEATWKYVEFNLNTGLVANPVGAVSATMDPLGDGWYLCTAVFENATSASGFSNDAVLVGSAAGNWLGFSGDGSSGLYVTRLETASEKDWHLPYQRVNTATDYDTVGFPHYLKFDGIDDNWVSAAGGGGTAGIYYCGAIKFNKVGAVQTIFSDAGTNSGYKLQLTAANQLQISAGNGTAFTAINTTDVFALGDVSLCELWDDGTNLGVRLGEGTPVTVARPAVTAGTAQITIGKDNNAASSYAGINMFEPVWRYGAMPNTTQREAIRAICRSKAGIA